MASGDAGSGGIARPAGREKVGETSRPCPRNRSRRLPLRPTRRSASWRRRLLKGGDFAAATRGDFPPRRRGRPLRDPREEALRRRRPPLGYGESSAWATKPEGAFGSSWLGDDVSIAHDAGRDPVGRSLIPRRVAHSCQLATRARRGLETARGPALPVGNSGLRPQALQFTLECGREVRIAGVSIERQLEHNRLALTG